MRLLTFVALFGVAAVTLVSCETFTYRLLGNGEVNVTMMLWKCKNNKVISVPTKLVGVASVASAPRTSFKSNTRFTTMDGEKNPEDALDGDERGHLVASTIGGPPNDKWNMVPQRTSVNRKISNESSIMGRWKEFEEWIVDEIKEKNTVYFTIEVNYEENSGCRPVSFKVDGSSSYPRSPGYGATFDNRPDGSFGVVSLTQQQMKEDEKKLKDSAKAAAESSSTLKRKKP